MKKIQRIQLKRQHMAWREWKISVSQLAHLSCFIAHFFISFHMSAMRWPSFFAYNQYTIHVRLPWATNLQNNTCCFIFLYYQIKIFALSLCIVINCNWIYFSFPQMFTMMDEDEVVSLLFVDLGQRTTSYGSGLVLRVHDSR